MFALHRSHPRGNSRKNIPHVALLTRRFPVYTASSERRRLIASYCPWSACMRVLSLACISSTFRSNHLDDVTHEETAKLIILHPEKEIWAKPQPYYVGTGHYLTSHAWLLTFMVELVTHCCHTVLEICFLAYLPPWVVTGHECVYCSFMYCTFWVYIFILSYNLIVSKHKIAIHFKNRMAPKLLGIVFQSNINLYLIKWHVNKRRIHCTVAHWTKSNIR